MTHELIWSVLNAQQANATLTGTELRRAAEDLIRLSTDDTLIIAFDAAGERIIGAAMVQSESGLRTFDYARPFPPASRCVLVGGRVAGPVRIAEMARAVVDAGASSVEVALLGEWTEPIDHVSACRTIGSRLHAKVA